MAETVVMDLTEFLLARIAEDEEFALLCQRMAGETAADDFTPQEQAHAAGLFNRILEYPEAVEILTRFVGNRVKAPGEMPRVLAECEAKRRIVALIGSTVADVGAGGIYHSDWDIACFLALPYADHPDYDETWRP